MKKSHGLRALSCALIVTLWSGPVRGNDAAPAPASAAMETTDLQILKARLKQNLRAAPNARTSLEKQASAWAASQQADGAWPDVNYADAQRGPWATVEHLKRAQTLASAAQLPGNEAALWREAALRALDFWLAHDYRNPNWWHNVIGVPQRVGEIALLLEDQLSPAQKDGVNAILDRSTLSKNAANYKTGANLVWLARNQITRGVLMNERAPIDAAFEAIWREIAVAAPGAEGVQSDNSFHQHGPVLYLAGYGAAFSSDAATFAELARDTRWQIAPEKLKILRDFVLDGQQWATRNGIFEPGARGREITRPGTARISASTARRLATLAPERRDELDDLQARAHNKAGAGALVGNHYFWQSDFMAHQRPGFYASARGYSTRVANTDSYINGEGKLSHHIADGANFLLRRGDEYDAIFPVWNWQRVPGTTVEQTSETPDPRRVRRMNASGFVGGVSDGRDGVMALDLKREGLSARKAWFFMGDQYACLGAGITSADHAVSTSINQTLLQGAIESSRGPIVAEQNDLRGVNWVRHDDVIYQIVDGAAHLFAGPRQGNWNTIGTSDKAVKQSVFDLWIDHGMRPVGATYAYIVRPGAASDFDATDVQIIANTPVLQAVWQREGRALGVVFYEAGRAVAPKWSLSVDKPCLALARARENGVEVTLSNPENAALSVEVAVTRGAQTARVTIALPGGARAGSSVTRMLSF